MMDSNAHHNTIRTHDCEQQEYEFDDSNQW